MCLSNERCTVSGANDAHPCSNGRMWIGAFGWHVFLVNFRCNRSVYRLIRILRAPQLGAIILVCKVSCNKPNSPLHCARVGTILRAFTRVGVSARSFRWWSNCSSGWTKKKRMHHATLSKVAEIGTNPWTFSSSLRNMWLLGLGHACQDRSWLWDHKTSELEWIAIVPLRPTNSRKPHNSRTPEIFFVLSYSTVWCSLQANVSKCVLHPRPLE